MVEINWTLEAQQWLKDIHDYLAKEHPQAAKQVVEGIYNKVQLLKQFPELGYRVSQLPGHHIRIILHGHYRIAYLLKPDRNIDILGIFHNALDIDRYLL